MLPMSTGNRVCQFLLDVDEIASIRTRVTTVRRPPNPGFACVTTQHPRPGSGILPDSLSIEGAL